MNTKLTLYILATGALLVALPLSAPAQVVTFTDDFDRATFDPDPPDNYNITEGDFTITSNQATNFVSGTNVAAVRSSIIETSTSGGDSFEISVDINFTAGFGVNSFGGIVMNLQEATDTGDYYTVRLAGDGDIQWARIVNGGSSGTLINDNIGFAPVDGDSFNLTVASDPASSRTRTITLIDNSDSSVVFTDTATDAAGATSTWLSGAGGLFVNNNSILLDNLEITQVPEPSSFALICLAGGLLYAVRRLHKTCD